MFLIFPPYWLVYGMEQLEQAEHLLKACSVTDDIVYLDGKDASFVKEWTNEI